MTSLAHLAGPSALDRAPGNRASATRLSPAAVLPAGGGGDSIAPDARLIAAAYAAAPRDPDLAAAVAEHAATRTLFARLLDPDTGEIIGVRRVRLQPRPFSLLARLAAEPGHLVGYDDLIALLWDEHEMPAYPHARVREVARLARVGIAQAGAGVRIVRRPGVGLRVEVME